MVEQRRGGEEEKNFTAKEQKIKQTLTPEQKVGERIDKIGAENVTAEEEQEMMNQLFAANPRKDGLEINSLMYRLLITPTSRGYFLSEHEEQRLPQDYKSRKAILRYPQAALPPWGKRAPEDVKLVFDEVRKQKEQKYFRKLSNKFEFTALVAADLRYDLITAIEQDLESGQPVLLRGFWRVGKSSILRKLELNYGEKNTIREDMVGAQMSNEQKSLAEFQKRLLSYDIASFTLQQDSPTAERADFNAADKLAREIENSDTDPADYLKNYLDRTGKTATILLDEVTSFIPRPDQLEYISRAFIHPKIKLVISLHYFPSQENLFAQTFKDYKSHSMRPLTTEELATIARKPTEGSPVRYTKDFVAALEDITGGRPWEAVYISGSMMGDEIYSKQKLIYRKEDLDRLMSFSCRQLMDSEGRGQRSFIKNIFDFYRSIYFVMSDEQKVLLEKLAESRGLSIAEVDPQIADYLVKTTAIIKDEKQGTYKINGELLRKAIVEKDVGNTPRNPF